MAGAVLPPLVWRPTLACSPRYDHPVRLVVVHRWGARFVSEAVEQRSYHGVQSYFADPANHASAHIVYGGVELGATQMVAWADMAWAEAAYNPVADDVESSDELWLTHDLSDLAQLARIVSFRLRKRSLPPLWSTHRGFCRHADLGAAGGGHTSCPTTDLELWRRFVVLVQHEYRRGGFRHYWGRG